MSVNTAIEEIITGESGKSMVEMFDDLAQEIVAFSFAIIRRKRKDGVGTTKEDKEFIDEAQYQLEQITKVMMKAKKLGRLPNDKPNEKFDEQLREKIKEEIKKPIPPASSIAPIVAMVPVHENPKKAK